MTKRKEKKQTDAKHRARRQNAHMRHREYKTLTQQGVIKNRQKA